MSGSMRRLASLAVMMSLTTGCLTGIDQKPYDIHIGPRLPSFDPDVEPIVIVAAMLLFLVAGTVYVAADQ